MSTPAVPAGTPLEQEVRAVVTAVLEELLPAGPPVASADPTQADPEPPPAGDSPLSVAVGADHGGYHLKEHIAAELRERGIDVHDAGTHGTDAVDYPVFAHAVARMVADGTCRWGVIVDGAGIGSCMVANKVPGIRAATCWDLSSARNSREHNHANVLTLGAGLVGERLASEIVQTWLATPWGGDRHARRVAEITEIERQYRYLLLSEVPATR
jgi:ribose 5-phosphate isomerase B